ncbi:inorganic phosphate transporter [Pseudoflavonifractor sp. 524-17]|uniref:inorganic phosphate transporter n=1 Tax=Pseudoflavonifractor sp. 524-17 TaxID=2304577 RepID=UPI001379B053|nr:inorganic phosphate transporter [Pseudoflavonifractor sp. 524-17]NCE63246.1 inorganic phosphate transporter [Pseudoflavonifractor sp. 524-17]
MPLSAFAFLSCALRTPALALVSGLLLAVLLVNGWTDAPNAIATAVAAGALSFRRAAALAAGCNLAGVLTAALFFPAVAQTVNAAADFGGDAATACAALCAALTAVVLWAVFAWYFGIPTSESHALLAGLAGAALALPGGWSNLRPQPWGRVALGLALSVWLGWRLGRVLARPLARAPLSPALCRAGQITGAAAMAFLHGAQDGQKFLGVFLLGAALAQGRWDPELFVIPLWLILLCALTMAFGTLVGGRRIVEKVGSGLVPLSPAAGLSADLAGGGILLLCTLLGLPVSTTHAKTSAILGAGTALGRQPNRTAVGSILLTWLFTFPGCAALGFLLARLLLR